MRALGRSLDATLRSVGFPAQLRRRTGTTGTFVEVSLRAAQMAPVSGTEVTEGRPAAETELTISATELRAANWPLPPRKGDLVVWSGRSRTISDPVRELDDNGTVYGYRFPVVA
jgi:hypothetical protein